MTVKSERLQQILAEQNQRMGPSKEPRRRAMSREMWGDTHKTMPAEDFGPSYQNDPTNRQRFGSATIAAVRRRSSSSAPGTGRRGGSFRTGTAPATWREGPPEFKSVFKPRPEQEHVCSLAKEHRERVANSEWALIDTLEVKMYLDEKEHRARVQQALMAAQRGALDRQMSEQAAAARREEEERNLERRVVEEEIERYKHDSALKAQQKLDHNRKLGRERQYMLDTVRAAKEQAAAAKRADEQKEIEEAARQLEEERHKAQARMEAQKAQWLATVQDNERRIAARKAAQAQQRVEDEELMRRTIETLERQEKEREEKLKAFQAMIDARANRAGQKAVAENKERAEREARLVALFHEQKEAEFRAKEEADKAKRAALKADLQATRAQALAAKAARDAAAKEEVARLRAEADAKAAAEAEAAARKMAAIRARATSNKDFLRTQMMDHERSNVLEDTSMSEAERRLNMRLLEHAQRIVGQPTQFSVKLY